MAKLKPGKPKGERQFQLSRFTPSEAFAFFIEHFWIVEWDLGKNTYQQDILAYPSVHIVFEKDNTKIYGLVTEKFSRTIENRGKVVGIKFRPGGFFPFWRSSVSSFSDNDNTVALDKIFEVNLAELENQILAPDDKKEMVQRTENFIARHLPEKDERVQLINRIIKRVTDEKDLIKVDQLIERFNISKRSLQRLFKQYVGVSPKWIIKRFRLHEAAGTLAEDKEVDWTQLALKLGYFDQAHFINDFKSIVGKTPAEYARSTHTAPGGKRNEAW